MLPRTWGLTMASVTTSVATTAMRRVILPVSAVKEIMGKQNRLSSTIYFDSINICVRSDIFTRARMPKNNVTNQRYLILSRSNNRRNSNRRSRSRSADRYGRGDRDRRDDRGGRDNDRRRNRSRSGSRDNHRRSNNRRNNNSRSRSRSRSVSQDNNRRSRSNSPRR